MAEIPVHKKSSLTWLWILLALLLAALLLWWLLSDNDDADEAVQDPGVAAVDTGAQEPLAAGSAQRAGEAASGLSLAAILANPTEYIGQEFAGEVDVGEVPTDRGFWIESQGARMLALINDGPLEVPMDINPDQRLRITSGTVRDADDLAGLPGEPLDADTRTILDGQDVFMLVNEDNMEILQAGTPQPGTSRAPSAPPAG